MQDINCCSTAEENKTEPNIKLLYSTPPLTVQARKHLHFRDRIRFADKKQTAHTEFRRNVRFRLTTKIINKAARFAGS
jgi:hypothetical protein